MNCSNCGTLLPPGAEYCSSCGAATPRFYSESGSTPNAPTVAAPHYGTPASEPTVEASPHNTPPPPYEPPSAPPPPLYSASSQPIPTSYGSDAYPPYSSYYAPPYGANPQNPYGTLPSSPYQPGQPTLPPPPSQQRGGGNRMGILIGVVLLVLVLIGAGLFAVLSGAFNRNSPANDTSATATAQALATAHAAATGTAVANATASAAASQNPYPPHTGTLVLNDPMQDNSRGYMWDDASLGGTGTCGFSGGVYHVKVTQKGLYCEPEASSLVFSNLAFEAKITIVQGDGGGIVIRQDQTKGTGYLFDIDTQGDYALYRDEGNNNPKLLTHGSNGALKKGLNQSNLLAIVADGSNINLYINNQFIDKATDSTYTQGQIGIFAAASNNGADDVAVNDARVWQL